MFPRHDFPYSRKQLQEEAEKAGPIGTLIGAALSLSMLGFFAYAIFFAR